MATPEISIIIPLYNHEKYIEKTLRSVLVQSFQSFEIIIIDDGSTDNSVEVVQGVADERIFLFCQKNRGAHNALNTGITHARGKYLAILNSDDVYTPDRLDKCYHLMEADDTIDMVCTAVQCIDAEDKPLHQIRSAPLYSNCGKRSHKDQVIFLDLLADNFLTSTSNIFCHISVLKSTTPFREFRYCHDWDFFLRLSYSSHIRMLAEPLLEYRIHEHNTLAEDKAGVYFEVAIVLADFFHTHGIQNLMTSREIFPEEILKSLRYHYVDRMLAILSLNMVNDEEWNSMIFSLLQKDNNPLYVAGVEHIRILLENDEFVEQVFLENEEMRKKIELLEKSQTRSLFSYFSQKLRSISILVDRLRGCQ